MYDVSILSTVYCTVVVNSAFGVLTRGSVLAKRKQGSVESFTAYYDSSTLKIIGKC